MIFHRSGFHADYESDDGCDPPPQCISGFLQTLFSLPQPLFRGDNHRLAARARSNRLSCRRTPLRGEGCTHGWRGVITLNQAHVQTKK